MIAIHHLDCGTIAAQGFPPAPCRCLLLEEGGRLALVDTGIGLQDALRPMERLGPFLLEQVGFRPDAETTAVRQLEGRGLNPTDVGHIVLTHADPDHTGGLADFPDATVHLSVEERNVLGGANPRYVPAHFEHGPRWRPAPASSRRWFGLEARPLDLGFTEEVLLVPLFGHTLGHCGVAVAQGDRWLLHVGDAYYLPVELETDAHPISALTARRADDNAQRQASLRELRRLAREHAREIAQCCYHAAPA